jgi:hypothetical protein
MDVMRLPPVSLLLVLVVALTACSAGDGVLPPDVEQAWEQYRAEPNENTYLRFIQVNRAAARAHAHPDDAQGVLHQLLALEAQSEHAARGSDLWSAQSVVERVDELEQGGVLDTYDEVVPGAGERFRAARARVAGLLE